MLIKLRHYDDEKKFLGHKTKEAHFCRESCDYSKMFRFQLIIVKH